MSEKPRMDLAEIFYKLDAVASSVVVSDDVSIAAKDAARVLRELTSEFGLNPMEHGADSLIVSLEKLKDKLRDARQ